MKDEQGRLHSAPATIHHRRSDDSNSIRLTSLQRALAACANLNARELEALVDILAVRYARRFLARIGALDDSYEIAA
jgi:hypothetical protein